MKRILIAGIGNIFFGDDAFGVEVAGELLKHTLPSEVRVKDFGIRGYDLACALADGYDAAILVDATSGGEPPGTLYLIEPNLANPTQVSTTSVDGHSMDPVRVLQMAETLGGRPGRILLVGCEPNEFSAGDGRMGLSDLVQASVPKAVEMIQSLLREMLKSDARLESHALPA